MLISVEVLTWPLPIQLLFPSSSLEKYPVKEFGKKNIYLHELSDAFTKLNSRMVIFSTPMLVQFKFLTQRERVFLGPHK